ncbi:unnamed protein product [Closterium sp. Yama58-4]|nr:unnamed protein product [Closterium sp. Yama58-4]
MAEDQVWRGVGWGMEGVRHREFQQREAGGRADEELESAASALPMQRLHPRAAENPAAVQGEELEDGEWVAVEALLAGLEQAGPQVFEETERGFEEAGDRIAAGGRMHTTAELMRRLTLVARSVARASSEQRVRFIDCMAEIREFGTQMQALDSRYFQDYDDLTHENHEIKAGVVRERDELTQLRTALSASVAEARAAAADAGRAAAAAAVEALEERLQGFFENLREKLKSVVEQVIEQSSLEASFTSTSMEHLQAAIDNSVLAVWEDLRAADDQNNLTFNKIQKALAGLSTKLKGLTGPSKVRKPPTARGEATPKAPRKQPEADSPDIPISSAQRVIERFAATSEGEEGDAGEAGETGAGVADIDLSEPVRRNWRETYAAKNVQKEREKESEERRTAEARKRQALQTAQVTAAKKRRAEKGLGNTRVEDRPGTKRQEEERKREEARKVEREKEQKRRKDEEERKREEARKAEREKELKRQKDEEARKREEARKAELEREQKRQEEEERKREEARKAEREKEEKRQKEEEERKREEARKAERKKEEKRQKEEEEERKREEARKAEREKEEKRQKEERKREEARKAEREKEEKRQKEEEERKREETRKAEREKEEKRQKEEEERKREEARKAEREKEEKRQKEEEERKREEARKAEREKEEKRQKEEEERKREEARKAEREKEEKRQKEEEERKREEARKAEREKEEKRQKEEEAKAMERRRAQREAELEAKRQQIAKIAETKRLEAAKRKRDLEIERRKALEEIERIARLEEAAKEEEERQQMELEAETEKMENERRRIAGEDEEGAAGQRQGGEAEEGWAGILQVISLVPDEPLQVVDLVGEVEGSEHVTGSGGLETQPPLKRLRIDQTGTNFDADEGSLGAAALEECVGENVSGNQNVQPTFENVMNKTNARVKDGSHFQVAVCTGIGQALVHGGSGLVSPPANVTPAVYAAGVAATLYTLWCASIGIPHQDWAEGADEAARGTLNEASLASRATSTARLGVWTLKAVKNLTHEKADWEVVLTKAILGLVDPEPGEAEAIEMAKVVSRVLVYWCECCHANQSLYAYQGGMLHFPQPTKGGRRKGNAGGNE